MPSADLHTWPRLENLARRVGLKELPERRQVIAAVGSALCNAVFFVLLFRHNLTPGDAQLLAVDAAPMLIAAPATQSPADTPGAAAPDTPTPPTPDIAELQEAPEAPEQLASNEADTPSEAEQQADAADAPVQPELPEASVAATPEGTLPASPTPRTVEMPSAQQAMLSQRMLAAVERLNGAQSAEVAWAENGQIYTATLSRQPSQDSMGLEHVVANITTTGADGMELQTQLQVQRLAFSQFTQVVDYWDSGVQLHDDEIVGRFHSNTPFAIAADGDASPKFFGKVTTAARALTFASTGAQRRSMFEGGLQTRTGRIEFPQQSRPFEVAPDADSYVQTFSSDTRIVFAADGSYTWQSRGAKATETGRYPQDRPSYFIASKGATLFVRGVVDGKLLVYSPQRVVIEGNLIYAVNPRTSADVDDYLGIVSDRNVEIAAPSVTGRGDLNIHAAIFARNRFVVTYIDYNRPATLFLYGSLTVGSISATEPRYATKIEFDPRFDRVRPPGFPNTNRYEVASWQGSWSER